MIRWITENIGTGAYDDVSIQTNIHIVDVRDMVDKKGNTDKVAEEKIQEALSHLTKGEKVVICCDYGMSRSNAVAAGVVSRSTHLSFNEAVRKVIHATGEKAIKVEVLSSVRKAIERNMDTTINKNSIFCKRILVTGSSGDIGTALIPILQTYYEVFAPTREDIDLTKGSIDLDLLVKEQGIDTIVHIANPRIYTNNQAMGETLIMLKNVLDVCAENRVKLVYPSDWEIYSGYRSEFLLASEVLPAFPKGPYGEAKYLCEILLDHYQRQYGIKCVIIRSSSIYGTGNKPKFIYNFLNKAIHNEEIITHRYLNGFPSLDLLHIDDFISAMVAAIEGNYNGAFNVGSGKGISTTEVAQLVVKVLGSNSIIKHQEIKDFAPNIVMDSNLAKITFGWRPNINSNEGISKVVDKFIKCFQYNNK